MICSPINRSPQVVACEDFIKSVHEKNAQTTDLVGRITEVAKNEYVSDVEKLGEVFKTWQNLFQEGIQVGHDFKKHYEECYVIENDIHEISQKIKLYRSLCQTKTIQKIILLKIRQKEALENSLEVRKQKNHGNLRKVAATMEAKISDIQSLCNKIGEKIIGENGLSCVSTNLDTMTQADLNAILVSKFQMLAKAYYERLERAKQGDLAALDEGPSLWSDYYECLKSNGKMDLLKTMSEEGTFFHGKAPRGMRLLEHQNTIGGKMAYTYVPDGSMRPSEIIKNAPSSPCFLESRAAAILAIYLTLLEILGDQFDRYFAFPKRGIVISSTYIDVAIGELFQIYSASNVGFVAHGAIYSALQRNLYMQKHFHSDLFVFRAIAVPNSYPTRYIGFGGHPDGLTYRGIEKRLVDICNREPIPKDAFPKEIFNEHLETCNISEEEIDANKNTQITAEEFKGGIFPMFLDRDLMQYTNRMDLLLHPGLSQIRVDLDLLKRSICLSTDQTLPSMKEKEGWTSKCFQVEATNKLLTALFISSLTMVSEWKTEEDQILKEEEKLLVAVSEVLFDPLEAFRQKIVQYVHEKMFSSERVYG